MNPVDLEQTLKTMKIIVDTREHETPEAIRRWQSFGVPYIRDCIESGDYSAEFTSPNGEKIDLRKKVVIERKMSITEICSNFCANRKRFINEFERIKENHTRAYLVVEGANWENIYNHRYRSQMTPQALISSLTAWMARYDVKIVFCKSETSPKLIREILYREAKEILKSY